MRSRFSVGAFGYLSRIGRDLVCRSKVARSSYGRAYQHPIFAEPLERRIMLSQTVDVGGLRFLADSFSQTSDAYMTTGGTVVVGFAPSSGGEAFRGLLNANLVDVVGDPQTLTISPTDLTFEMTGGSVSLISLHNDREVLNLDHAFSFPILSLTTTAGVAIQPIDGPQAFNVASFDFTANNLQLINPSGGDTADSEVHVRGDFDFNSVLGDVTTVLPEVKVEGQDFVATSPDISPTLNGATFTVPVYSGKWKSVDVQGALVVTYDTDQDQNDYWSFSGSLSASSQPQDNSNKRAFENIAITAGITTENSDIVGILGTVTGGFNLFGATIKTVQANPLSFEYNFVEDQYEWTGGLSLVVNGNQIDANLGFYTSPELPGLVVKNGIVETANATVSTKFSFFGVQFQTTPGGVTLQYDRSTEQYAMFGGMQVVDSLTNNPLFALQMGTSAADAGILVKDGSLKQLDTMVTSNTFKAGPLNWRVSQAGFKWTQDNGRDVFIVFGSFYVQELWQIAVTLGDGTGGDNSGMIFSSDGFELDGFQIALKNINVGFLTLEDFLAGYQKNASTGDYDIDLAGSVFFPQSKKSFSASMVFDTDKEAVTEFSFSMAAGGQGFELGTTGLFVTGFGIEVQNPATPSSFEITGDVALVYGDQIKLGGDNATILAGTGSVTITKDEFVLDTDVYWGAEQTGTQSTPLATLPTYKGVLGSGSGILTLDWGSSDYSLDVSAKLFKGAFDVDGTFKFDGTANNYFIYFEADAKVSVPDSIPFIGGQKLADFHFVFDYHSKDEVTGEPIGYAAAWTKLNLLVTKKEVGFLFDIKDSGASNPRSIGKHTINEIKDGDFGPDTKYYTYSKAFAVPAGATVAEFQVQWAVQKGTQTVAYEFVPTGGEHSDNNIIQQADFGKNNNATLIANSTDAPTTTLLTQLQDPQTEAAGTYYYYLYSSEKFDDDQLDWQFTYSIDDPQVSIKSVLPSGLYTDPTIGVDIFHENAPGLASQTTVTLYADTDPEGYDGFKVKSFVPTSDAATYNALPWNLTSLPLGTYYLYASINDGINTPVYSDYTSAQTNFMPTGPISGYVLDNVNGNVGVPGVQMYLDANDDGAFEPASEPSWTTNGEGYYRFDYEDANRTIPLQSGKTYKIGLIEVEGISLIGNGNAATRPITSPDVLGDDTTFELQINTSIAGTVFQDTSQNGAFDAGEKGAQGWRVYVDLNHNGVLDVTDPSAVTTSDGAFRIFNLEPKTTYTLRLAQDLDAQSNFFTTSPTSITVTTGSDAHDLIPDQNFGVLEFATISGTINNYPLLPDGSLSTDAAPPPAGWQVQLLDQDGTVVATTTASTTDGTYTFEKVIPGNYTIHQVVQSDWLQISPVTADTPAFAKGSFSTGSPPVDMVTADFDLDGDLDVATVSAVSGGGEVHLFLNNGHASFTLATEIDVSFSGGQAFAMEVVDGLPNTTGPSLAVVSTHGWVSILTNKTPHGGGLNFARTNNYQKFLHGSDMHGVTAGDFDEDGVTDLAASYEAESGDDNRFSIILMKDAKQVDGKHFEHPGQLTAADMNNDGHIDLVLNSGGNETEFNVAYGNGTGVFTTDVTTWFLNGGLPDLQLHSGSLPVAVGDVNADGLPDVLAGAVDPDTGLLYVIVQTQSSESGFFFQDAITASPVGIEVGRIEGQAFPNVAVLEHGDVVVLDLDFDNGGAYGVSTLTDVGDSAALGLPDVNNDGLPDMLVADGGQSRVWVYLNKTTRDVDISLPASAGQLAGDQDFTNDESAQITGTVYDDGNLNGTREGFERGLSGVRVFIDRNGNGKWDHGERYTYTNADGAYAFDHLPPKQHTVSVELPEGRILTGLLGGLNRITIGKGDHRTHLPHVLNFGLGRGIQLTRYSDSVDAGHDWTLRRNGAYLELVDNAQDVVLERHLLREMHRVTLFTSNFAADTVTIDFTYGGAFTLPGGIHIDGGRDGLAGGSTLRFLGRSEDKVESVSDTQVIVDGTLTISWTDNLAAVSFDTDGTIAPAKAVRAKHSGRLDFSNTPLVHSVKSKTPATDLLRQISFIRHDIDRENRRNFFSAFPRRDTALCGRVPRLVERCEGALFPIGSSNRAECSMA